MDDLPPTFVPGFHDEDAVRRMPYRILGNTGLKVSMLGLGTGTLGGAGFYGDYDEEEAIATVKEAIRKGINYIDTAPYYGQGRSEEVLGKALKDIPREAYYIATKVGRYELDPIKMFDFSSKKTLWSVDNSLKKLGLRYVDIIQVHDVEFAPSVDVVVQEPLPALEQTVKAGKAHFIGITGYPVSALKEVIEQSTVKISTVLSYTRSTLIDDTLKSYIPYFQDKGLGIINAASVAMGLLTNNGPQPWHPASESLKKLCAEAGKHCKERGVELGRLAQYHSLKQPGAAVHVCGMNNRTILHSNLDLFINGLSEAEKSVLEEVKSKYFNAIKPAHWEGKEIAVLRERIAVASKKQ